MYFSKHLQPVIPKVNKPWIFIGMVDFEAEAPKLWPTDVNGWLIGKYSDAGKDEKQEQKGMTGNEMDGWHRWVNRPEFEQPLGDSEGQGILVC